MYVYTSTYIYIYINVHVYYICVYVCMYIYIYIYALCARAGPSEHLPPSRPAAARLRARFVSEGADMISRY